MRQRRCSGVLQLAFAAAVAALALSVAAGVSGASWASQSSNPGNAVTGATLPATTGGASSSASVDCQPVTISWARAAAPVDDYRLERSVGAGAWQVLAASTGDVTSYTDTSGYTNATVQYRVTARRGSWLSGTPSHTNTLTCGISSLSLANPCAREDIIWTNPNAATTFDVESSPNGGTTWTRLATDLAAAVGPSTTYTDTTQYPMTTPATAVLYRVRPGIGATVDAAAWSVTGTEPGWRNFSVASIQGSNGGVTGQLDTGDSITVTFTKPVANPTFLTAPNALRTRRTQGQNQGGMDLAWNGTVGQIGALNFTTGMFGTSATSTTANTLSRWPAANQYQWIASAQVSTSTGTLNGTFTHSAGLTCADGTGLQANPAIVLGGSF